MKRQNRSSEAKQTSSEVSKSASLLGAVIFFMTSRTITSPRISDLGSLAFLRQKLMVSQEELSFKSLDLKAFPLCRQHHTTVRLSPILQPQQNAITKNLC